MSDIIQLLPDSVANQIAAGEVIQRPASVIKELIENSLDAGASEIIVAVKDAGKTLIQVSDNGKGMSESDARMAFERHATSKIRNAEDLFSIRSMGFRGEALASIAAVADVELKTKQADQTLGTYINIKGSELISQESISCQTGSNFIIKNLFFNIPARRKFLKKESTELNNIIVEFQKTALANPDISMSLYHNNKEIHVLRSSNLQQRIGDIFGKNISRFLVPLESKSEALSIYGYVGKPEIAKKRNKEQFFYVNKRYMKHPYFYKAVMSAYENIISSDSNPSFFIFFDISPDMIDINIHPQKTEINFEDTPGVYQILRATVRQSLGKFNIVPSIDFDRDGEISMPYFAKNKEISEPEIEINPSYNPFNTDDNKRKTERSQISAYNETWERLMSDFSNTDNNVSQSLFESKTAETDDNQSFKKYFQIRNKYIVTPVKSGLMVINQKRAHERILFETFMKTIKTGEFNTQKFLYPIEIEIDSPDFFLLSEVFGDLCDIGFDIESEKEDFIKINGMPAHLININPKTVIENIIINLRDNINDIKEDAREFLAETASRTAAVDYGIKLANEEIENLIETLFSCMLPNFTNDGRKIISIINYDEIEKLF